MLLGFILFGSAYCIGGVPAMVGLAVILWLVK